MIYCSVCGTIGKMYILMGDFDSAEDILEEQLNLSKRLEKSNEKFNALLYLSKIMIDRGNYDKAQENLNEVISHFQF